MNETYYFLLLYMADKVLFLGQIFEMEILMDLQILRFHESENHIFSIRSVCMCVSDLRKTQKQIRAETSNLAFYICIIYRCYLENSV